MERKSAFWEKVEALIKKNAEAKAKASGFQPGGKSFTEQGDGEPVINRHGERVDSIKNDHQSDVFGYFFRTMGGSSSGGRSRVKPPSFCKPGIKIDHKPLLQKKSSFDNAYGHSRLRSEGGTFYLNLPEGNIEQFFDVQDAILV